MWPILMIVTNKDEVLWTDTSWGNTWSDGSGYLGAVLWGENLRHTGWCRDNRLMIDPDDVKEVVILGITRSEDEYYTEYGYLMNRLDMKAQI